MTDTNKANVPKNKDISFLTEFFRQKPKENAEVKEIASQKKWQGKVCVKG